MSEPWRQDGPVDLGYRIDGPDGAPVLFLGPSLGTNLSMFDRQVAGLAGDWRIVRHDLRGHGTSPSSAHPFTLADMAADVIALADRLGIERFSYAGVSISGAIAQALAVDYPQRLDRLVICASAPHWPDHDEWVQRAARVRREGTGFFVPSRTGIWFSAAFAAAFPEEASALTNALGSMDREAYAACCDAIGKFDGRGRLHEIAAPTLVIAGEFDVATPLARAQEIAAGIAGAELVVVPGALHLLNVERDDSFNALVRRHLSGGTV